MQYWVSSGEEWAWGINIGGETGNIWGGPCLVQSVLLSVGTVWAVINLQRK